jgi:hypothetical protein
MLFKHPENTTIPENFTYSVINLYPHDRLDDFSDFIWASRSYQKVAAIDADTQSDRVKLVRLVDRLHFTMIELDEQLSRETLTPQEYVQLQKMTYIPIGLTSTPDCLYNFCKTNNLEPRLIFPEYYEFEWLNRADLINTLNTFTVGIVNIADSLQNSSRHIEEIARHIWLKHHGIWFWGANTGNPDFDLVAQKNWLIVEKLTNEWCYEDD